MSDELLLAACLALAGSSLGEVSGFSAVRRRVSVVAALPLGIGVTTMLVGIWLGLGLAYSLVILIAAGSALVVGAVACAAVRGRVGAFVVDAVVGSALATACTLAISSLFDPLLTFDSYTFVLVGRGLHDGALDMSSPLLSSYPLTLSNLQAMGRGVEADLVVFSASAGGVLGLVAAFDLLLSSVSSRRARPLHLALVAAVVTGIWVATFMLRLMLPYLNSHMLMAGFVTLTFALYATTPVQPPARQPQLILASMLSATIALSRAEGLLVLALLLVAAVPLADLRPRDLMVIAPLAFVAPTIWYAGLILGGGSSDILSPSRTAIMLVIAAGPLIVVAVPGLRRLVPHLVRLTFGGLAVAALVTAFVESDGFATSASALIRNLAVDGQWGVVWWAAVPLTVGLALVGPRLRGELGWHLMLFGYPVVILLLGAVRETPYRLGFGDSANRIMMHIVPLGLAYIAVKTRRLLDANELGQGASTSVSRSPSGAAREVGQPVRSDVTRDLRDSGVS